MRLRSSSPVPVLSFTLAAAIVAPLALNAQTITPLSPEVHSFNPPMVLEYGLDEVFKNPGTGEVVYVGDTRELRFHPTVETAFRNYNCRGVTLERVTFQFVRLEKETSRRLRIASEIFNNSGKDKRVTITFDVINGSDVVGSGTLKALRVQQGDYAKAARGQAQGAQEVSISLTQTAEGAPYPRLRVTMDLTDY